MSDLSSLLGIALKHHTSKLESFNDIYSVQTFGFRGEAINALCELSESLIITTKTEGQSTGAVLKFDQFGSLVSQSVIARANGTTIQVNNLFERLPVRRKDFVK
jgi:DNA mismatch repair protein PMS2